MNATVAVPPPRNEPVFDYAPGSPERARLEAELKRMAGEQIEIPCIIGGQRVTTGRLKSVVMPHDHRHVLARFHAAGPAELERAAAAAQAASREWQEMRWEARAAVFLRAAELIAGPRRMTLNAATMLGQSKTAHQAEIDAACELIDFLRFNVQFASRLYAEQPESAPGMWNQMELRALEGFILALTPFNFTAIAGNLPTSPAMMGNTVVWKPAEVAMLSAYYIYEVLEEAGLPPGVINMLPGSGAELVPLALERPDFAGIHFTGFDGCVPRRVAPRGRQPGVATAPTRASSARPAARTSSWPIRRPSTTPTRWSPPSCAAATSTRARSAPRRRASTCRSRCGVASRSRSATPSLRCAWATCATSRTSWAR